MLNIQKDFVEPKILENEEFLELLKSNEIQMNQNQTSLKVSPIRRFSKEYDSNSSHFAITPKRIHSNNISVYECEDCLKHKRQILFLDTPKRTFIFRERVDMY